VLRFWYHEGSASGTLLPNGAMDPGLAERVDVGSRSKGWSAIRAAEKCRLGRFADEALIHFFKEGTGYLFISPHIHNVIKTKRLVRVNAK